MFLKVFFLFSLSCLAEGGPPGDILQTLEKLNQRIQVLEEEARARDKKIEEIEKTEQTEYHLYECAWQNQWGVNYDTGRDEIVKYDKLSLQASNIPPFVPSLNFTSGVFTCQVPGVYQVTVSLNAHDNTEHTSSFINLYQNGVMMEESYLYSSFGGDNYNWGYEMAARTVFLSLEQGDTVYLYCENCFDIQFVNICFKLDWPRL